MSKPPRSIKTTLLKFCVPLIFLILSLQALLESLSLYFLSRIYSFALCYLKTTFLSANQIEDIFIYEYF